ncbi:MAG: hypothetical protein P1R58_11775 [bacterium]|nr:hypothetical protein [bacterium]
MTHPTAKRTTLLVTAGLLWTIVGIGLIAVAIFWLITAEFVWGLVTGLGGILLGYLKYRFMFSRIVRSNIDRVYALSPEKERICVFAFQAWSSYLIALVMMSVGMILRQLPIPRPCLASLYLAIGLGLFLSSLKYYRQTARLSA